MSREQGFTLVEQAVASAVALAVLAGLGVSVVAGLRTASFGTKQSSSLDDARLVLNQVARDLQGSKAFSTPCVSGEPAGSCVIVVVQPPSGPDQTIRYRLEGSNLYRERDDGTGTFPSRRLLSRRVVNLSRSPAVPLFSCAAAGPLMRVTITMVVQPDPLTSPTFQLRTVVRPRNAYLPPGC